MDGLIEAACGFADTYGVSRPEGCIGQWWENVVRELREEDAEFIHSLFQSDENPMRTQMKNMLASRLQLQESS